ncbi:MAG: hypothetical protein U9N42_00130 [Campylobacterota bacterium]|nr:hypothetical protein [Campylobacterota bacterium]
MKYADKFKNIEDELPNLLKVFKDAIQSEVLEIKRIDSECTKYKDECSRCADLKKAKYVIFSPYIKKEDHKFEQFVFIDELGNTLCHAGGSDFELYGMLKPCSNLEVSEEYIYSK